MSKGKNPRLSANGFNAQAFLESTGLAKKIKEYGRPETVFSPGDRCDGVMYIQQGGVKLSVLSKTGREAVVAMLGPGEFFGEGCLAGRVNPSASEVRPQSPQAPSS